MRIPSSWQILLAGLLGFLSMVGVLLLAHLYTLYVAASAPVEGILVLGGSIQREIHAAQLVRQFPQVPVLISSGSKDPCVVMLFQKQEASLERVWLEKCARSTFDNFFYTAPILEQWGVRKVKLVTSATHLPRAQLLAQILLGARGIWVDLDIAPEDGVPGNREFPIKTVLDVTRSVAWAIASQLYTPKCSELISLADVDLDRWQEEGFRCERQAQLEH